MLVDIDRVQSWPEIDLWRSRLLSARPHLMQMKDELQQAIRTIDEWTNAADVLLAAEPVEGTSGEGEEL